MISDTQPAPLNDPRQKRRVVFDPTVNLGHILTFVGFLLAGFGMYANIDKRLTVAELQNSAAMDRAADQDRRMKDALGELKIDIKDVQRAVNDINRTLAITGAPKK